jgi:putative spermidine/putrescine transport system ATP-binding protein
MGAAAMSNSLRITGLARQFDRSAPPTLDGLELDVPAGGCVALLGPSGSGKSTVLRLVAGLDDPDAGQIEVGGQSVLGLPPEKRRTALVFQRPRLFPHLSVLDNVSFPLTVHGVRKREARDSARQFLDLVGLADLAARRPSSLSGGQEQRVSLARALAARPGVILLDEPFSALDPELRSEMHELVVSLRAAVEPTILLVTHDRDEAVALADTVAILLGGRVVQHDVADVLFREPTSLQVHLFLGGRNAVAGTVRGEAHHSALGALHVPGAKWNDNGPATLVIRQEDVRVVADGQSDAHVVGTVVRSLRAGARTSAEVECNGYRLTGEVTSELDLRVGQRVGLVLPVRARHVIPTAPTVDQSVASREPLEHGEHLGNSRVVTQSPTDMLPPHA